jgi:hypothetical protein
VAVVVAGAGLEERLTGASATNADRERGCEQTGMGSRSEGTEFETPVNWREGYWRTTILGLLVFSPVRADTACCTFVPGRPHGFARSLR